MKKLYVLASLVALLINIQIAQADTDSSNILAKGSAYVTLDVVRSHSSNSFRTAGSSGVQRLDLTFEIISLSYGLGDGWQVGMNLNNKSSYDLSRIYDNGQNTLNTKNQGQLNSGLWVKYGFVDEINSKFSLAGEFKVLPNFRSNSGGEVIANLHGIWNFGDGLSVATTYTGQIPQNPNNSNVNTISVDASKAITNNLILNPNIYYSKIESNNLRNATQQYGVGLTAHLNVGHSSYIQSSASVFKSSPQDSLDGTSHWGEVHGRTLSLLLYHLF